jgi:two-component system nitrogen regulation sensor histidine kinase NtrY
MFTRSFTFAYTWRIILLAVLLLAAALAAVRDDPQVLLVVILTGAAVWIAYGLFRYVTDTNRRLARFFESVRYSDFAVRFSSAREKGSSFEEINRQFNEVLEAFRQTRAEKEANLLFLNTIVQHLSTGLLTFDGRDAVLLSNNAAFQLLGVYRLHHLHDLPERHRALIEFVEGLSSRGKLLYQPEAGRQLSVQGVHLTLQGRAVRLLTLQNIHPELQRKELDAWRNLTRVLRHEIMNSVTPIVSLVETMQDIVRHDLSNGDAAVTPPGLADLTEALEVVAVRSRGLMSFVDAYRTFTTVPPPRVEEFTARQLLDRVTQLTATGLKGDGIALEVYILPEELRLRADPAQLEMVLLNLIKNARESLVAAEAGEGGPSRHVIVRAGADARGRPFIEVEDNGPGIDPGLLEEIFIPFFTTKTMGSGIGLSISRQILQLHGGDLRVSSKAGGGARFVVEL